MNKAIEQSVQAFLIEQFGSKYNGCRFRRSGVGCINETWEIYGEGVSPLFLKVGRPGFLTMYEREKEGLEQLARAESFHVPEPLAVGTNEHCAFILMEFLALEPVRKPSEKLLGEALAELHGLQADKFGLEQNNFIGRANQYNGWYDHWWTFFCEQRIAKQLDQARENGMRGELLDRIQRLNEYAPDYFADHSPIPSLLHGDLWSGNIATDRHGKPSIYDPAIYYGDAETDLAMTQMFGALGQAVYDAYFHHIKPKPGMELRRSFYDLYHWLNHFNLFGVNYLGQVERSVNDLHQRMV